MNEYIIIGCILISAIIIISAVTIYWIRLTRASNKNTDIVAPCADYKTASSNSEGYIFHNNFKKNKKDLFQLQNIIISENKIEFNIYTGWEINNGKLCRIYLNEKDKCFQELSGLSIDEYLNARIQNNLSHIRGIKFILNGTSFIQGCKITCFGHIPSDAEIEFEKLKKLSSYDQIEYLFWKIQNNK